MDERSVSRQGLSELAQASLEVLRDDTRCLAILLFGSAARRQEDESSDLDLLVLYRDEVPEETLDSLNERVSVSFYDEARWRRLRKRSPLFAIHLAREGLPLYDPDDQLDNTLRTVNPLGGAEAQKLAELTKRRLRSVLSDPGFGPHDQISTGELYALAKQTAFLISARQHDYVFDRHRALSNLAETIPELRADLEQVALLEASWLAARPNCQQAWADSAAASAGPVRSAVRVIDKASLVGS